MQVHDLKRPKGARKKKRIVGRGQGSGRGKTSGRGQTGQNSRSGRGILGSLEGGQMSLIRRLPKIGFRSKNPIVYQVIKLDSLNRFESGSVVNAWLLKEQGLIKNVYKPYKILGDGNVKHALTVQAYGFSKTAVEKIEKAGGKVQTIDQKILKKESESKAGSKADLKDKDKAA